MKRFFLLAFLVFIGATAQAQFIGYTSPQSVQVRALNAVTVPTTFVVPNLGQSSHYVSYTTTGSPINVRLQLEASFDGITFQAISTEATDGSQSGLFASGYFPVVRANLIAISGGAAPTVTAFYSGTSSAPPNIGGIFNRAPANRVTLFQSLTISTNPSVTVPTPYGNSSGYVALSFSGPVVNAGCLLNIDTNLFGLSALFGIQDSLVVTTSGPGGAFEVFPIVDSPAQALRVRFLGCSSGTTVSGEYYFTPPNTPWAPPYQFNHIIANTTTPVKQAPGFIHTVIVNTRGGAGNTATIFDSNSPTCAGGIAIAVIDTTVTTTTYLLDIFTFNGICVTTAGGTTPDLTITFK